MSSNAENISFTAAANNLWCQLFVVLINYDEYAPGTSGSCFLFCNFAGNFSGLS